MVYPYQFAGNTPIQATDIDGKEIFHYTLDQNKDGIPQLKYDGEQTRHIGPMQQFKEIFSLGYAEVNWSDYNGPEISKNVKRIEVRTKNGTIEFNSFKELNEWKKSGYPSDRIPKETAELVSQFAINEMYFGAEMADGKFDGDFSFFYLI